MEEEYHHHHHHHRHKRSTFMVILLWPVQILSWMWHDIKPSHHVHYRHHRSFMRRMWDSITDPFHQMAKDLHGNGEHYHHQRSFMRRFWDGTVQQFHWMAKDLQKNVNDDKTFGEKLSIAYHITVDSIKGDFIFRLNRETMAQILYLTLILLILIRIIAVWQTMSINGLDPFYTLRHIVFTLVWASLLYFFFNLFLLKKTVSPLIQNFKEMERASLLAFIACIIKFATSASYIFVYRIATLALNWATAYYIGELLIWAMLSIFLFFYWRGRRTVRINATMDKFES